MLAGLGTSHEAIRTVDALTELEARLFARTRAKLDCLTATVRRETEGAEADPFDDTILAAVMGLAESLKVDADALAELEVKLGRLARRAVGAT